MNTRNQSIDDLLAQAATGDSEARLRLVEQVYPVLKGIAKQKLVGQAAQTMRTTDVAHEAYLRLFSKDVNWASHGQFFAIAATAIRGVLVDHFRARSADKRGSGEAKISLDEIVDEPANESSEINWLDLSSALDTYATEAAYNIVANQLPNSGKDQTVMIVDVGAVMMHINVLHDNKSVYTREQAFGGAQLTQEIQRRFGLSVEEAEIAKRKGLSS